MLDIENFIHISCYAGMREDLVQAGGGNSSIKLDNQLLRIKASGVQLTEITENYGYVDVDYRLLLKELVLVKSGADYNELLNRVNRTGGRPSIETVIHSVTPAKYTLHTHPTLVNMLVVNNTGIDTLRKLFPDSSIMDYASPGLALARTLIHESVDYTKPVFLKNHGLIVCADSAEEIIGKTEYVVNTIADYLNIDNSAYRMATEIYDDINRSFPVVYYCRNVMLEKAGEYPSIRFDFCPDCIVYCQDENTVKKRNGHYYIVSSSIKKAREIESVLAFAAEVALYNLGKPIDYLSQHEQMLLTNRDDEKYRKNLK